MTEKKRNTTLALCFLASFVALAPAVVLADAVLPTNASIGEESYALENPGMFSAQVSNFRATIRSYMLVDEQFVQEQGEPLATTPRPPDEKLSAGPLDMVTTWDVTYYPYSIHFEEIEGAPQVVRKLKSDPRHPEKEDGFLSLFRTDPVFTVVRESDEEITMVWPDPASDQSTLFIERTWKVAGDYMLDGGIRMINLGEQEVSGRMNLVVSAWDSPRKGGGAGCGMMFAAPPDIMQVVCKVGEDLNEEEQADIAESGSIGMGVAPSFTGVNSRYFLMAAIPREGEAVQCLAAGNRIGSFAAILQWEKFRLKPAADSCLPTWLPAENAVSGRLRCIDAEGLLGIEGDYDVSALGTAYSRAVARVSSEVEKDRLEEAKNSLLPGNVDEFTFSAYIGPKFIDELEKVGVGLEDTINFWVLGFLCKPMLWLLRTSYDLVPSWGLAIILLTLIVKLITIYPTQKSMVSMRKMSELKPKMDEIRKKHEGDKTKMNQAMMDMYKREKVNPMGGCLPMLLQMPIWIALYRTIYGAVDLYQEPLFLWINDLSSPDPYYVMPFLLGALMFAQQKMTPVMGDQTQAKVMMYMMPVMFTVFMLFLPSGLVFYILVNTLLAIGHQWWVRRPLRAKAKA